MSFVEAYEEWKIYAKKRHKKQGFYNLTHDFKCRILPYFENVDIFSLTKKDMLFWQNEILKFNFSNSYNKRLSYVFNSFLDYLVMTYDLSLNPLKEIGSFPKRNEEKKEDYYTIREFHLFINNIENIVYKTFFEFMFFTGVRPGEAMALRFCDIENNIVHIKHNLQRKGKRELDTPKNQSSIRDIAITRRLKRHLFYLQKIYNCYDVNLFVFGGLKPLAPTTIDRIKKNACEKANLRCITQHQFRHSHATLLLQNGILINEISRRLGHSKVSTTLDIYTHTDFRQEKKVLTTLNFLNLFYNLTHDFKTLLKHKNMF